MAVSSPRHILVVEDVADISTILVQLCQLEGYTTTTAWTGTEALAAAGCADLVLLDLVIPAPDGFEVARVLRATHPGLPIVAVTALSAREEHERALAAGVDEVVVKPFDLDRLVERIAGWLESGHRTAGCGPERLPAA
jgi:two-component system OmpR family response regulator